MSAYSPADPKPLKSYAAITAVFNRGVAALELARRRSGRRLPERYPLGDTVLLAVPTHKFSRLVAKDRVTSFLRAPFVTYQEDLGESEVSEEARGEGSSGRSASSSSARPALGNGSRRRSSPDTSGTRTVATVFTCLAASDFISKGWVALRDNV